MFEMVKHRSGVVENTAVVGRAVSNEAVLARTTILGTGHRVRSQASGRARVKVRHR